MAHAAATYARVRTMVATGFEISEDRLAPETDLVALTWELGDPERLEEAMAALEKDFGVAAPTEIDKRGREHRLQLFIPETLTVAEICERVESGEWPRTWTQPGKVLRRTWLLG